MISVNALFAVKHISLTWNITDLSYSVHLWSPKSASYHWNMFISSQRQSVMFLDEAYEFHGWEKQNTSSTESPSGVCNRYTSACFPYQNSSWTLNDTLCEVYGWFISLWGSKHCTGHHHSPCGAKEKDFAIKYKNYCGRLVLLAAVSLVVFD